MPYGKIIYMPNGNKHKLMRHIYEFQIAAIAASKTFRHPCFKKLASADLILFEVKAPEY